MATKNLSINRKDASVVAAVKMGQPLPNPYPEAYEDLSKALGFEGPKTPLTLVRGSAQLPKLYRDQMGNTVIVWGEETSAPLELPEDSSGKLGQWSFQFQVVNTGYLEPHITFSRKVGKDLEIISFPVGTVQDTKTEDFMATGQLDMSSSVAMIATLDPAFGAKPLTKEGISKLDDGLYPLIGYSVKESKKSPGSFFGLFVFMVGNEKVSAYIPDSELDLFKSPEYQVLVSTKNPAQVQISGSTVVSVFGPDNLKKVA